MKMNALLILLVMLKPGIVSSFATSKTKNQPRSGAASTVMKASRVPWEFTRFLTQSSKFVNLPFIPKSTTTRRIEPGALLWTSDASSSEIQFGPLDDVVMGGASSSTFDNASGTWRGQVTDANNGGFIGIRSYPAVSWNFAESVQGIKIRLRGGNGNRFKFVLRDSTDFNGVCWTTSAKVGNSNGGILRMFDKDSSSKDVSTIKIPFKNQIPTIFAKTVPDQTFDRSTVSCIQLAYSKFEYDGALNPDFELGDVDLQIVDIEAY